MNPLPSPAPAPAAPALLVPTAGIAEDLLAMMGYGGRPGARLLLLALEMALLVGFFLLARWIAAGLVKRAGAKLVSREEMAGSHGRAARVRTLTSLLESSLHFVLGFIFLVSALALFGVNVAAIVGTASVAGLAFGFGAQKLVKDVITGFFLIWEDQYAVGEYVTISGVSGSVEDLGMRTTRIRDDDGRLYILSNGDIVQVCNHARGPVAGSLEIGVAATADLEIARKVIEERLAAVSESLGLAGPAQVEGLSSIDAARAAFKITFRVPPGHRPLSAIPALRDAVRDALHDANIPIA